MSGGHFNYDQYKIEDIAASIDELINKNDESYYHFPSDIISLFDDARKILRLSAAMAQRIDLLVSGDDGEDTFRARWSEDINQLRGRPVAWAWEMHGWIVTAHGKHLGVKRFVDTCRPPVHILESDDFIKLVPLYE